ncbi:hypothetical protein FHS43_001200 [Streptosporangium becharense]|uniref:Lectin-like protein BA14k n=1 Tax=Streptosporangium becharense TaxID=1816182 RepID=A0A7W9IEM1_9ACTN|nr:hypothetical protein [Streptosporangium becharense]MBB2909954.1 hypothetical protein [Streptosporangium becharense]MBB5819091.1 hypothetical protein [Streptosporangium becharense]
MSGRHSSVILRSALVVSLALPQGFAAEVLAAPSPAGAGVTTRPAQPEDPCHGRGHGCAKGVSDGRADGARCIAESPGSHPDSGQPDYGHGYSIGHAAGWAQSKCGERAPAQPQNPAEPQQSRRAQQRAAGEARGADDAATFHRCKRSSYRGQSRAYKRGYRAANQYC